jgi:hypothetical protein
MPVDQLYLLSATAFRIAVILSGTLTTYLGYRLLLAGITAPQHAIAADATARFGKTQFALRRLTPGALFALFGMSVVTIMLYRDPPEYRQVTRQGDSSLVMRGDAKTSPDASLQEADELLRSGQLQQASRKYADYFEKFSTATNNFAWTLLQQSRTEEALVLSRLALSFKPGDTAFMNTYVTALEQGGQKPEADRVTRRELQLEKASPQDPRQTNRNGIP